MEFRKMVTITLYMRQQKRHWCVEQSFGLCGRGRGWDDLGEWHWNMYNIIYETSLLSRFDARYWMLGAGALGRPRGMVRGGRREEGSGWGTCVYMWQIHVDIWQNQYNIIKLKIEYNNKIYSTYMWYHMVCVYLCLTYFSFLPVLKFQNGNYYCLCFVSESWRIPFILVGYSMSHPSQFLDNRAVISSTLTEISSK